MESDKSSVEVPSTEEGVVESVDVNIGDKVYITELSNENYEFLHPDNTVVCQVRRARAAMALATEDEEGEEGDETSEEGAESTKEESAEQKSDEAPKEE